MPARTKRQREILDYITDYVENRGHQPSYQQIATHFKLASKSGVSKHIKSLEDQGLLSRREENGTFNLQLRSASIKVNDAVTELQWAQIPEMKDEFNEFDYQPLFVQKSFIDFRSSRNLRLFQITDEAMSDEHIVFGDYTIIEKRTNFRDGDIVLAIISNKKSVLRKFYREGAFIELRPANDSYDIIRIAADKIDVRGVFRGLLRPL